MSTSFQSWWREVCIWVVVATSTHNPSLLYHRYSIIQHSCNMSTSDSDLWTSKLGNKYPKEEVESNHDRIMKELNTLRRTEANSLCADCGQRGTIWSSVNLGVFLCLRCGSLHRALGTHISKPKGCSGTYLWGEDEIARMKEIGNAKANKIYGGIHERPSNNAPESEWLEYLRQKYEQRKFAPPSSGDECISSDPSCCNGHSHRP